MVCMGAAHLAPSPPYPLAAGTLARDTVLAMICIEHNTNENAEGDAHAFLDFVTVAIPTETFTAYTAVMLTKKIMEVASQPFPTYHRYPLLGDLS